MAETAAPSLDDRPKNAVHFPDLGGTSWPTQASATSVDAEVGSFLPGRAPSVVSEVRTRPRTDALDVPECYYSRADIRRFKREFRRDVEAFLRRERQRERRLARRGEEEGEGGASSDEWDDEFRDEFGLRLGCLGDGAEAGGGRDEGVAGRHRGNSYWRKKLRRRWGRESRKKQLGSPRLGSPAPGATEENEAGSAAESPSPDNSQDREQDGSADISLAPESAAVSHNSNNNGKTPVAEAGMFSLVLQAVSMLNGTSSKYYDRQNQRLTTTCAVDTMYLF